MINERNKESLLKELHWWNQKESIQCTSHSSLCPLGGCLRLGLACLLLVQALSKKRALALIIVVLEVIVGVGFLLDGFVLELLSSLLFRRSCCKAKEDLLRMQTASVLGVAVADGLASELSQ